MNRRKPLVLLMIAAILGMLATSATARFLEKQETQNTSEGVQVLAAARDIEPGVQLTKDDVKEITWPSEVVPESLVVKAEEAVDRYANVKLAAGEPLIRDRLSANNLAGKISDYVPDGYRAMAIEVDKAVNTGGLLAAGSRVDVLAVFDERSRNPVSRIILQNIKVLSVGERKTDDDEEDSSPLRRNGDDIVTLLLRPNEAEKLVLAMTKGKIQVMARGTDDIESVQSEGCSAEGFLPQEQEPEPVVQKPEPPAEKKVNPEELYNKANTLEAKGNYEAAKELYEQIADQFSNHKVAADAVARARETVEKIQRKLKLEKAETALESARAFLQKGLFEECRTQIDEILEDFGNVVYRGEKVSDIVAKIKLKVDDSEKEARVCFQLYQNWLKNGDPEKARSYLQKLQEKYPESGFTRKALELEQAKVEASVAAAESDPQEQKNEEQPAH